MDIYIYGKDFFKQSNDIQSAIIDGVKMLYTRINTYENQGTPFNRIFNDDNVKYDKHGEFCTFKHRKNTLQIRIEYAYLILNNVSTIVVADFVLKKKNNKKYISRFEAFEELDPMEVYNKSVLLESV